MTFFAGTCLSIKQKVNGHSADYLKRQAKNIKRDLGIPFHEALDKSAVSCGFSSWKHFINDNKGVEHKKVASTLHSKTKQIIKANPHRKLLVEAINKLLDLKLISLNGRDYPESDGDGHIFIDIFGYLSMVSWSDIGFQELRISVWWKYDHSRHPQANLTGSYKEKFNCSSPLAKPQHYKNFVGVVASGWLERKSGKYLQGKNNREIFDVYTRRGEKAELDKIPLPKAIGFESEGKVHL